MTSLTIVRRIAARPAIVFEAVTTADGIASWWGPDAGPVLIAESDPRVGGRFRVRFRVLDGNEYETTGEYLEVRAPERVAMTWRWADAQDADDETRIEIDLRAVEGGTEVTFTQSRFLDAAARDGHLKGWNGSFDKLERRFSA